ncbi:MAG TPA: tetratricopeptide repeat protein [Thermoanaerobaculia bacterium]|nr:tetratricopeptide repeat protein [Thermoanaerobaculia bacterium]
MNPSTDWVSAIAILAGGLLLGALFVFFFTRRRAAAPLDADLERKDLEAKRDALVAQLRALPDDAIDERARLESATADVLRQLDKRGSAPAAAARVTPAGATAMNPTVKGFLWGAGSFAALAALGYFVMQSLTPRQDGQEATGTVPMAQQQQQQPATDPIVQQLEAAVQRNPDNFDLRNALAQAYLERDNMMGVFEQTKYVLDRKPNDSRAMTFNALVRVAMGEVEAATAMLQRATKVDPQNLDGWVALAWVYAQSGRMNDAEAAIGDAARVAPNEKAKLEQVLAQMKAQAAQAA